MARAASGIHTRLGVGWRVDTPQCAAVLARLERFDWEVHRRAELGALHARLLAGVPGISLLAVRPDRDYVWGQYTVFVEHRAVVQAALKDAGVPTAVHYPTPLHFQPAYAAHCCPECCPVSLGVAARVLSLPMSADLTEVDQDRVIAALAYAAA